MTRPSVWKFIDGSLDSIPESPIIVSYYTSPFYQREAFELARSCQRFSMDYHIEGVPDLGSWIANTNHKPAFLMRIDQTYPDRNIVWVDADGRIRQYPTLFNGLSVDVAFHSWRGKTVASGTVFLRAGEARGRALRAWLGEVLKSPMATDQVCLGRAIKHNFDLGELPVEYCWIYDHVEVSPDNSNPVIEHMQASRWAKRRGR